jgi:hypothetical protein
MNFFRLIFIFEITSDVSQLNQGVFAQAGGGFLYSKPYMIIASVKKASDNRP